MNRITRWALAVVVPALVIAAWLGAAERPAAPANSMVATVGPLPITREEFERRATAGHAEFERRRGEKLDDEIRSILDRQILESLIRANLLVLEARRTGVQVSDAEAEAQLKNDPFFNAGGKFDQARFLSVKNSDPAGYHQALERTRAEAAARRLGEQLRRKHEPGEERVRRMAERSMSNAAIQYLLLPRYDFGGDFPEPREPEVIAYYRAHPDQFQKPARATLSIVKVESAGRGSSPKARADSALAAIRNGAAFDEVGAKLASVQSGVVVMSGNFPGYWRGDARVNESVFLKHAGTVLAEPVASDKGFLLVRVDEAERAHVASLRETASSIRTMLREAARTRFEEHDLRALYESRRDSMKGPAYKIRYAVADTGRLDIGRPTAADLERFYRAHLADYTSYDAPTAAIVVRPLGEVRDEIVQRWDKERRVLTAKSLAESWLTAWSRNTRDRDAEHSATLLREVGPITEGGVVDTGLAGRVLTDSLSRYAMQLGVGMLPYARGLVVYHVYERTEEHTPSFDEVKKLLAQMYREQRMQDYERLARQVYDRDPQRFATGKVLHFSRVQFEPMSIVDVPLTRAEVERYYRDHLDKYSSPERLHARHILISPENASPEADAAALKKAKELLARIRAGEDFANLAERYSDDPPTRSHGGDLGSFSRGAMLENFERTAFAMRPGEVSEPVKTEVGYHIIKVLEHEPLQAEPLVTLYSNVGADAATEKAQRLAQRMADSIYQMVRTPAEARRVAQRLKLETVSYTHSVGGTNYPENLRPVMARLENVPLGKLYPGVVSLRSSGAAIMWPDSVSAAHAPSWNEARDAALEQFIRDASLRAVEAKRAELDSMMAAGWSLDSVGVLWGGLARVDPFRPGAKVRVLGETTMLDSLVFGGRAAPVLAPGQITSWIDLPAGLVRLRLDRRTGPSPNQLAARMESERRLGLERNLFYYYEDLKKRFSVRILDPRLRDVLLPPPPPENAGF